MAAVAAKATMSRAKLIMDKASTQQLQQGNSVSASLAQPSLTSMPGNSLKSTTDVLETAVRLGVKIIAADRMMSFLDDNVKLPGRQKRDPSPSAMKSVKAIPMLGPFVKVESMDQRTRPIARAFRTWPDLVLEPGTGCPFRPTAVSPEIAERMKQEQKRKLQKVDSNQTPVPSPIPSPMPSPLPQYRSTTPKDDHLRHSRIIAGGGRRTGVASWSRITPQTVGQAVGTGNRQTVVRGQQAVKRKALFCELCGVEFEHLNDHIRSHTHERFMNDPDNYKELVSVISSLPKLSDLVAANMPVEKKEEDQKEGEGELEAEAEMQQENKENEQGKEQDDEKEDEAATEACETSAYDVTHLRDRMSVATIAVCGGGEEDAAWSVLNHAHDVEL